MDIIQKIVKKHKDIVEKCGDSFEIVKRECDDYFKEIDLFLRTDKIDFFKSLNGKENEEPATVLNKRKGRLRKPALAEITENDLLQAEIVNVKREKISDVNVKNEEINMLDKDSEEMPAPTKLPPRKKKIKTEKPDLPKRSTRTRTKKAKEQEDETISDNESIKSAKNSDIIIQNTTITTIDISDSEKETDSEIGKDKEQTNTRATRSKMRQKPKPVENPVDEAQNKESADEEAAPNTRSTRTKTKQPKKRARSSSLEQASLQKEKKKSKSDSIPEKECNVTHQTEYEDAVSVLENDAKLEPADATYVASSKNSAAGNENVTPGINTTVIVENPKIVIGEEERSKSPTSPHNFEDNPKTPPKASSKNTKGKQIFSPFDKTPLKKKVEAFERLGAESSAIPTRVTRTKKKTKNTENDQKEETDSRSTENLSKQSSEKEKLLTPITTKFMPKVCSTSKINKLHPIYTSSNTSTNNDSVLSVKSASALKASQAEFREREKRRQEKEREALRKREAMLQAQTEEKRRKREEKQQRAQQQREAMEKEMQKQLEAQKIKEEKFKQAMAEREKKLQKQKEDAEKKRMMAKKKANELHKEKEEMMRMAEQKKMADMKVVLDKGEAAKLALKQKMERAHQQNSVPIYMTTKPPLLPTADCYDSDDPEYELHRRDIRVREPSWTKERELRDTQLAMIAAGESIKNSFFCRQVQTPDLQEIFEIIDPRKLKRTSSAIWRKPPRYTLMPTLEDTLEFSEDSDE